MLFDMNDTSLQPAEALVYPDWPYTPPARSQVREQVAIRGSTTAGTTTVGQGTADQPEPPQIFP